VFVSLPFVVRELIPVMEELGVEQEQAAATLGAGAWQTFLLVTLPGIKWGLLYGATLTAARALGEYGAVAVVGGAITGKTETATLLVDRMLLERRQPTAYAASLGLVVLSLVFLVVLELLKRRRTT
jgi:sulfate transport system permease protein